MTTGNTRKVYDLGYDKESGQWSLVRREPREHLHPFTGGQQKWRWIMAARKFCRSVWKRGQLCQLVVHAKDGRFLFENTYGKDPERSKG